MIEHLGFEKNRHFVKDYGIRKFRAAVAGTIYTFQTIGEYHTVLWLEYRRRNGSIKSWVREGVLYEFAELDHPKKYLPDFLYVELDGSLVVVEFKTLATLDHQAIKKFKRMALCYPSVKIDLVMDRITPGKGSNKRRSASKYVRNVLDLSQIKRDTRKEVNYCKPEQI